MSYILTHDINTFVIYGITLAISSCHYDSLGLKFAGLFMDFSVFYVFIKIHEYANSIILHDYPKDQKAISMLYSETR